MTVYKYSSSWLISRSRHRLFLLVLGKGPSKTAAEKPSAYNVAEAYFAQAKHQQGKAS
jgi:hypothetical protein